MPRTTSPKTPVNSTDVYSKIVTAHQTVRETAILNLQDWCESGLIKEPDDWVDGPYLYIMDVLGLNDRPMRDSQPLDPRRKHRKKV